MWWVSRNFSKEISEGWGVFVSGSEMTLTPLFWFFERAGKYCLWCAIQGLWQWDGWGRGIFSIRGSSLNEEQKGCCKKFFALLFELPLSLHWANCLSCLFLLFPLQSYHSYISPIFYYENLVAFRTRIRNGYSWDWTPRPKSPTAVGKLLCSLCLLYH